MIDYVGMARQHIIVDGSNIATEGRSSPSLAQLEEAVAELEREHPDAEVTVIVDATFSHRIDPSELTRFEAGVLSGKYVHPPAGAIGRGDAFLLRVAEKVDGIVLSNDSFQEFHGEHPWLFERGRLLGATPVPGIGWIFVPRSPVRGPTSRKAVRDNDRAKKAVSKAIAVATKEAVSPSEPGGKSQKKKSDGAKPAAGRRTEITPASVNDPLTFIEFIAEHPLGTEVTGRVASYASHGAVVMVGNTQCYVPLHNLGDPAPRSARSALKRDEERTFVVFALDPLRRGVELALPGVAGVSGKPSEEMVRAEMKLAKTGGTKQGGRAAAEGSPKTARGDGKAAKAAGRPEKVTATVKGRPADREKVVQPAKAAGRGKSAGREKVAGRATVAGRETPAEPVKEAASRKAPAQKVKAAAAKSKAPAEAAPTNPPTKERTGPAKARRPPAPSGAKAPAAKVSPPVTKGRASSSKSTASPPTPSKSPASRAPAAKTPAAKAAPARSKAAVKTRQSEPSSDADEALPGIPRGPRKRARASTTKSV